MNSYEEKQEARRQRLEDRADRLRSQSTALYNSAKEAASAIPFGQPILVGHHSEKRDRNYRARYCAKYEKAHELSKAAGEVAARADSVGKAGVSSDDPDAVTKLLERLAPMKAQQERWVAANKLVRKKDRAGLAALGYCEKMIATLFTPDFAGRIGFPDYQLTNNSANIRRIEQRIAHLEREAKRAAEVPMTEQTVNGVRLVENREDNRMQLFFDGKPPAEIRQQLKAYGYRWAPSVGAWQRQLSNAARWSAQQIAERMVP